MSLLRSGGTAIAGAALAAAVSLAVAAPLLRRAPPGLLEGTDFGLETPERPRQILRAEAAGGRQSWLVALGNTAFSAPSLRGVRFNAPYGRDGRTASLREFARNVIVLEFGGPEPAPVILDALVAYMEQIEFLPSPRIDRFGRLTAAASPAAARGEALFGAPMAGMGGRGCATCHVPDALFADGRRHDIGSGGVYKTPTLLNARFTAPYFHDGRYPGFAEVVAHFDRVFALGLTAAQREDLVAYLEAVGDAEQPFEPMTRQSEMSELAAYVVILDDAIGRADQPTIDLVVDTVVRDLGFIARRFDNRDPRTGRVRRPDRPDVARIARDLAAHMTSVGARARAGDEAGARESLRLYRERATALVASYPQTN